MVKTNFKCMYLVDDILYKKIANPETELMKNNDVPALKVHDMLLQQKNDFIHQISNQNSIQNSSSVPDTVVQLPQNKLISKDGNTQTTIQLERDSQMQTDIPLFKNQQPQTDQTNQEDMDVITTEKNDVPCVCNINEKKDRTESMDEDDKKKSLKRTLRSINKSGKPKKARTSTDMTSTNSLQVNEKFNPDSDPELQEMRDRFNKIKYDINYPPLDPELKEMKERFDKIKYDINYPPPKNRNVKKGNFTKKKSKREKVTYQCEICNAYFEQKQELLRHIMISHSSSSHKKRKQTDDRDIRTSNFSDQNLKTKKRRTEYKCMICRSFFRSEKALNRHEKNIHDRRYLNSKIKRKRNDQTLSGLYLKRQKVEPRKSVTYQKYF